jgi:hypothetical protein
MQQVLPDVSPLVGVSQPGLAVTPPVVQNNTLGQVSDALNAGLNATAQGIEFMASVQQREDFQRRQAEQDQLRTEAGMRQFEEQFNKVIEGDAARRWATDRAIVLGQIDRGELPMPESMDEQALRDWAGGIIGQRTSGAGELFQSAYSNLATNDLLYAVQTKAASVAAKDREEAVLSLANSAALSVDATELSAAVEQGRALGLGDREVAAKIVLPAARLAAETGNENYEKVFRGELGDENTLVRNALDLEYSRARDQIEQGRIRLAAQQQRDIEIADGKQVKAYYDLVYAELASVAGDEDATLETAQTWLGSTRATMQSNTKFATELNPIQERLENMIDGIQAKREQRAIDAGLVADGQNQLNNAVAMYTAGMGYAVPGSVKASVQVGDRMETKEIPNFRRAAQEAAIASAPNFAAQVQILEKDTMPYQPWQTLLQVGAHQLYTQLAAINPALADAHAGKHADLYRDAANVARISGMGNNPAGAIRQVLNQRQNATGYAFNLKEDDLLQAAQSVGGNNPGVVASYINTEVMRIQRATGKTPDSALEDVKKTLATQFKTINGYATRVYDQMLPPGAFGKPEKNFEAVINNVASTHKLEAKNLQVQIDPINGLVQIIDASTGMFPANVPPAEREMTIDGLYQRADKIRKDGIINKQKANMIPKQPYTGVVGQPGFTSR